MSEIAELASNKIFDAIVGAMSDIGAIGKNRKNDQQNYNFRGIDDIYNALQPALIKRGIVVVPKVVNTHREERASKKGGLLIYTTLTVEFTFYCAEDGSSVTACTIGEGMDSGDKSANKAMSAAYKYAIFQTLAVPTEEHVDSEKDSPEPAPNITADQALYINDLMKEVEADEKKFLKFFKVACVEDLPAPKYGQAVTMLEQKRK